MDDLKPTPTMRLAAVDAEAAATFRKLREQMLDSGPLDKTTCELIVISGLAAMGWESSFKIHALRLVESGTPKEKLQHAVMVSLGATTVVYQVAQALKWIDELYAGK